MSNNFKTGWIIACLIFITACHKQRASKSTQLNVPVTTDTVATNTRPIIPDSAATKSPATPEAASVKVNEVDFSFLTTKSKVSLESKTQNFENTNVNIRMKKDSIIWLSVTGVGLEVARGIITPDTIVFMDKIHRDYFVFNYEQLSKQYNFDLNFALLQSIIIGNLPFPQQADGRFVKANDFYVLKQVVERLEVDNYVAEKNLKLSRLQATEVPTQNTFTLDYEDFRDVNSILFPFISLINLQVKAGKDGKPGQTSMRIKHNKVELLTESPGFPFNVPSGYKRKK